MRWERPTYRLEVPIMSTQLSPLDECPFDVPEEPSDGTDYDVWAEQVWAQVGDYDAYGPFDGRDDDFTPF
jgi:hypothetical protein